MKNKIFPIFLLIFITAAFLCGCKGRVKSPGISFASTTYNFGMLNEGESINHVFEFTNNGAETLIVKEVRPTCGCTVAGDFNKEVKPGQNGKIAITYNSSGFDGPVAKAIIVKTNVPGNSDYTLTLTGTVKASVNVNPKELNFGNIERNRTTPFEGTISISNRLPDPVKITDVIQITDAAEIPNVTVAKDNFETKIETIQDGFEYSLVVTVKPPFKYGQVMGTILVKTDSKLLPEIKTQFSYYMEPLVKIFPNPLFIGKGKIAKGEEQLINIECEPGHDMRIVDLSVNNNKVKVSLKEVERGSRYTIVLKFPKDFKFDPGNTLTVEFKAQNVPDEQILGVPVLEMLF